MTPAGTVTILAGLEGQNLAARTASITPAQFQLPGTGLCIDAATNIYVADYLNSTVRKISPTNAACNWVTTTIAGQAGVFSYLDAVGTNARFNRPYAVAVDKGTNLYVADYNFEGNRHDSKDCSRRKCQHLRRKCQSMPRLYNASAPTPCLMVRLGIAVDSSTNVYVADSGNNAIRRITPGGVVCQSLAANGGLINNPRRESRWTAAGNVYVANSGTNTILE